MAKSRKQRRDEQSEEEKTKRSLDVYLNQPNINMVVPWIYEIYKSMASSRDSDNDSEDEIEKGLEVYLNHPNIDMTIPWIYQIYKSVKSGGGGGSGGGEGHEVIIKELEWEEG